MISTGHEKRLMQRIRKSRTLSRLYCWSCGLSLIDEEICRTACPYGIGGAQSTDKGPRPEDR